MHIENLFPARPMAGSFPAFGRVYIHSIGRYGAWKYSFMEEAILDGKAIAEAIMKSSHG